MSSVFSLHSYSVFWVEKSLRSCPLSWSLDEIRQGWLKGWGRAGGWGRNVIQAWTHRRPWQGSLTNWVHLAVVPSLRLCRDLKSGFPCGSLLPAPQPSLPPRLFVGCSSNWILEFWSKLLLPRTTLSWTLLVFFSCLVTLGSTYPLGAMGTVPSPIILSGAHKNVWTFL